MNIFSPNNWATTFASKGVASNEVLHANNMTSRTPTTVLQLGCLWDPENRVPMYSTAIRYLWAFELWLIPSPPSRASSSDLCSFGGFSDSEGESRGRFGSLEEFDNGVAEHKSPESSILSATLQSRWFSMKGFIREGFARCLIESVGCHSTRIRWTELELFFRLGTSLFNHNKHRLSTQIAN